MEHNAILLPGGVLPSDLAYGDLIGALGDGVDARTKDLELYAANEPPPDYTLGLEVDAALAIADAAGFERFHLVGYSAGGAIALALAAAHGERLASLALLEAAWAGNEGLSYAERGVWADLDRVLALPADEVMGEFVRVELAPGVEPPGPPPGPPPPWMAKRPAGLRALTAAFAAHELDTSALGDLEAPVYYALGALSNPDLYEEMAHRLAGVFTDYTLEVFEGRHHFDPPHRAEPQRLAARLREHWDRAAER